MPEGKQRIHQKSFVNPCHILVLSTVETPRSRFSLHIIIISAVKQLHCASCPLLIIIRKKNYLGHTFRRLSSTVSSLRLHKIAITAV